jgi:hypothetical protein
MMIGRRRPGQGEPQQRRPGNRQDDGEPLPAPEPGRVSARGRERQDGDPGCLDCLHQRERREPQCRHVHEPARAFGPDPGHPPPVVQQHRHRPERPGSVVTHLLRSCSDEVIALSGNRDRARQQLGPDVEAREWRAKGAVAAYCQRINNSGQPVPGRRAAGRAPARCRRLPAASCNSWPRARPPAVRLRLRSSAVKIRPCSSSSAPGRAIVAAGSCGDPGTSAAIRPFSPPPCASPLAAIEQNRRDASSLPGISSTIVQAESIPRTPAGERLPQGSRRTG